MANNSDASGENTEEGTEEKAEQEIEQKERREEKDEGEEEEEEEEQGKKTGKWIGKIPKDKLLTPGGAVLLALALVMEILDPLFPDLLIPGASLITEIIPELAFMLLLKIFFSLSFTSLLIPFIIERIPIISDIIPTWFIKMVA